MSKGALLFSSNDLDIRSFKLFVKENWMLLLSMIQLVESKVKDTIFYKSTRKSEMNTSNLAIIYSLSIPIVLSTIKESDEFKHRVRRNNDTKHYLNNMKFNK